MAANLLKVTVLMPVYNGERYIRKAIDSILNQTFTTFEFLIIDDASTDSSYDIIRSYTDPQIKLIKNTKNLGLIKTLNLGLSLAKGQYIARQDQDDISHPTRLQKQVLFLDSHPKIALLGTQVNSIDQYGRKNQPFGCCTVSSEQAIRWQVMFDNPFVHPSVMMRAKVVRDIGGYNEHFSECEDYDLFSRIVTAYKTTNLKESLLDYRYHSSSMNANRSKENNLLIGDILRRTYSGNINIAPDEEWIDLWLSINNPYSYKPTVNAKKLVMYIEFTYSKFISIYPLAKSNTEIKKHISHLLIRISYILASKKLYESLYCFFYVLKKDFFLTCRFLPRYLIVIILGRHKTLLSESAKKFKKYCNISEIKSNLS